MPELPEVETLKLGLQKYLIGHKILGIEIRVSKIFQGDKKEVIGAKVTGVKRVGKGLIIELNNQFCLAVHLKMTGQLVYSGKETKNVKLSKKTGGDLPSKYSHVIFSLDDGATLYFNDLRRFGWIRVIKKDEVYGMPFFKEMGPEPFNNTNLGQKKLTLGDFRVIILKSGLPIKVLLMDQKKIGGIGNIYANEALFEARVNPKRKAKELNESEIKKLYEAIFKVIKRGLEFGGSSDENFVNVLGEEGKYQQHFLIYGKKGQKCPNCKGTIKKIILSGRGTYFCPACQK
ncbi:MAG: DNA-formamidopyrimidine glycosylase [Candidatus Levybacteria bacterium RBG_16_35_11]|nr:MAG: DNA-formamidopyrimidine glycosylase [Candidatus Levybacteria bacterium RBG_16_35_11]